MAFDQQTRTRLQRFVSDARTLLTAECTRQLQHEYGMDPTTGEVVELSRLPPLDDTRWETARLLRDTLAHYLATSPSGGRTEALQRIVREQAFTVLNRLVALRMMEARGLLLESIARGYQSRGFQLYQRLGGSSLGETGDAYRCYLASLFDEFALDLTVLFDRFSPQGRLFPRESALLELLALINHPEIEPFWAEDETIGWIDQYYNAPEERRQMRADSPAPRNSRELAVRNQFFTPRYVVEFLTDNTLGRLWYEMTQGQTALTEQCRYLVRRPQEIFLQPGEEPPAQEEPQKELSQEALLQQPVYIPCRALKDPREIRMLDPACGSMHFGLNAFDLFEVIYDEAWEIAHGIDEAQKSSAFFAPFVAFVIQYPDKAAFLADVPRLIIEHNLHGIDIDPRAAQIAGLSLWLRAQRTWQQQGLRPQDRPRIRRSNIVCAEPMPGEEAFLEEFIEAHLSATPEHKLLGQLVRRVFDAMKLAGEAGSLLKIEEEIAGAVAEAKQKWLADTKPEQGRLFADDTAPLAQKERGLDVTGITDETFWEKAEERIYAALQTYAGQAEHDGEYQRRLFADDAAHGFAFIDVCRQRYDVALMNPPFGLPTAAVQEFAKNRFEHTWQDIYASFFQRTLELTNAAGGYVGAITPKSFYHAKGFRGLRNLLQQSATLAYSIDIGGGVLEAAVEVCFSVLGSNSSNTGNNIALFCNLVSAEKETLAENVANFVGNIRSGAGSQEIVPVSVSDKAGLPNAMLPYRFPADLLQLIRTSPSFESDFGNSVVGITTFDNDRFIRLNWEPSEGARKDKDWRPIAMGGGWSPFYSELNFVVRWEDDAAEMRTNELRRYGTTARTMQSQRFWFRAGLTFSKISTLGFSVQPFPAGSIFSAVGFCIFPSKFDPWIWLGFFNSKPICCLMSLFSADRHWHSDSVAFLPIPPMLTPYIGELAKRAFRICAQLGQTSETAPEFLQCELPSNLQATSSDYLEVTEALAKEVSEAFALSPTTLEFLSQNAIYAEREFSMPGTEFANRCLSYAMGCASGRWDIRFATGEKPAPELPDPFAPLLVCPPGQLQNEHGLPITREDVTRLKEEGRWNYPLEIPWDGILVDDPGHPLDLEARVHQVLQIIWKDRWEAIEREACEILGVRTLCDYFRKPAGFFADHLKRYSKSRRKAPIYWPLQTPSGSYTLWLYYHRLNDQTLYTCVNDFVEKSKLHEVTEQLNTLRTKTDRSKEEEKKLDHLLDFEQELKDFREELLRVAQCWKPNLNDGVQITAAPLWKLFQHKPWQKTLKDTWDKLEKGDYDWAHLAYSIWPDRVRDKCRHDKSLAIAHELEELYEAPPEQPRKKRGRARG